MLSKKHTLTSRLSSELQDRKRLSKKQRRPINSIMTHVKIVDSAYFYQRCYAVHRHSLKAKPCGYVFELGYGPGDIDISRMNRTKKYEMIFGLTGKAQIGTLRSRPLSGTQHYQCSIDLVCGQQIEPLLIKDDQNLSQYGVR